MEVEIAPQTVIGLVFQIGDAEKFPQELNIKTWILFFFHQLVEEDGGWLVSWCFGQSQQLQIISGLKGGDE